MVFPEQGTARKGQLIRVSLQPEHPPFCRRRVRFSGLVTQPPPGGEDRAPALSQVPENLRFRLTKGRLPLLYKEFLGGEPRAAQELLVTVQALPAQIPCQKPGQSGLAAAGHTDQNNVLELPAEGILDRRIFS